MFYYKKDILDEMKKKGWSTGAIREHKLLGESYLQKIREGQMISWAALDKICSVLDCQPGDLIGHGTNELPLPPDVRNKNRTKQR